MSLKEPWISHVEHRAGNGAEGAVGWGAAEALLSISSGLLLQSQALPLGQRAWHFPETVAFGTLSSFNGTVGLLCHVICETS